MVAARLGFERTMADTGWATPCTDCMERLRKHYSHLVWVWFLARKAAWALSGCMSKDSADCTMLVSLLIKCGSGHGFSFGVGQKWR